MDYSVGEIIEFGVINLLLVLLLSPLVEGVVQKVIAFVHSCAGPPLYQSYADIRKLLRQKETLCPKSFFPLYAAVISFAAVLITSMLIPIGALPPLGFAGDLIVFLYLIAASVVMIIVSGISSEKPFGVVDAGCEMMMVCTVEPVLVIALITAGVKSGSMIFSNMMQWQLANSPSISTVIAAVTFFLAMIAQLARAPFDIIGTDQEMVEETVIEHTGPRLALFKWGFYAKQLIFASLFVSVFVPWPHIGILPLDILLTLAKILLILLLAGAVHAVNPRLRIDQSIQFFGVLIFMAAGGLVFALIGF